LLLLLLSLKNTGLLTICVASNLFSFRSGCIAHGFVVEEKCGPSLSGVAC
jgi:hypothetical protein